MKETISKHVLEFIRALREEFKALPFDFHSCFYFNSETQQFQLHRKYLQQQDHLDCKPLLNFKVRLYLG